MWPKLWTLWQATSKQCHTKLNITDWFWNNKLKQKIQFGRLSFTKTWRCHNSVDFRTFQSLQVTNGFSKFKSFIQMKIKILIGYVRLFLQCLLIKCKGHFGIKCTYMYIIITKCCYGCVYLKNNIGWQQCN